MARIFISHSSANNNRAIQLRDWLVANGWDDIFLDLDPERGIAAGERWKEALQKAAQHCETVLALICPEWLASAWCRPELNTAQLMGKKIIVLLIGSKPSDIPGDLKDAQYVDLINDPNAYTRLSVGLKRAGLDPSSFPFAEGRRPYPGFPPFEEQDAAIFFGRDAQIVRGLDKLRDLTRVGVERMLVILGASGCGKSSFLRAGLWPRLKRDDRTWLPLPTIRPERAVISGTFGLIEALYGLMNEASFAEKLQKQNLPRSRADIEEFVTTRDDGLLKILAALKQAAHKPGLSGEATPPPTIVIPIDQGEELFNEDGRTEGKRFIDILTNTLAADLRVLALLTIRTDSFPQFQNNPVLAAVPKDTFTLDMMLEGSYREVIEGPAALVKPKPLKIDPQLTEALLEDAAGQDALPLLAFTLRYLYDEYRANNELSVGSYEKLGRLKGIIQTTVKQAIADGGSKNELPKDYKAQLLLIRRAFIPHLARVNAAGQFIRRISAPDEIPPDARPLVDCLTESRLLIKDRRTVGREDVEVIEVAHEALLREWKDLNNALLEEREFLIAKGRLEQDVVEWQSTAEAQKKGALLRGNKLARAREWLINRSQDFTIDERDLIEQSVQHERKARATARLVQAMSYVLLVSIVGLLGWINQSYIEEQLNWWTIIRPYMLTQVRPYVLSVATERALKPKDSFQECVRTCRVMVVLPAGSFMIGSPTEENGRKDDEGPQQRVILAKKFAVSKFEVTYEEWDVCVAGGGCAHISDAPFRGPSQPIVDVSWDDAQRYAAWFSRMTGKTYRLLSEAEWEYAARAGSAKAYSWGDEIGNNKANCSGCGSKWDAKQPAPVGSFAPNEFGLYDMHGNVWEWVEDCYQNSYNDLPRDGFALEPMYCNVRVVRGGSYYDAPQLVRAANRDSDGTIDRVMTVGFRLARTLDP